VGRQYDNIGRYRRSVTYTYGKERVRLAMPGSSYRRGWRRRIPSSGIHTPERRSDLGLPDPKYGRVGNQIILPGTHQLVRLVAIASSCFPDSVLMVFTGGPTGEAIPLIIGAIATLEIPHPVRMMRLPPFRTLGALDRNAAMMPNRPTTFATADPGTIGASFCLVIVHLPAVAS
jgi:hypothetical protein